MVENTQHLKQHTCNKQGSLGKQHAHDIKTKKKVHLLFQQLFLFQIGSWHGFHTQPLISSEKSTDVNQKKNEILIKLSNNLQLPVSHGTSIICRMQVTEGIGANIQQAHFFSCD